MSSKRAPRGTSRTGAARAGGPAGSPLLDAARFFDEELTTYAQLGEAFLRAPLASARHLERVNDLLSEISACEQRLAAGGQALAQAVSAAHQRQQQVAQAAVDRLPAVKARMQQLQTLLASFETLGQEAGALNQTAIELGRPAPGAEASPAGPAAARDLQARMQELARQAQALAAEARQAEFEEMWNRAHALHQQLQAAANKLKMALVG